MTKSIPFRIRTEYLDEIERGDKDVEYRGDTPFWRVRLLPYCDPDPHRAAVKAAEVDLVAVFICGHRVHRRSILWVERIKAPAFSKQGLKDVVGARCFAIHLGKERKK